MGVFAGHPYKEHGCYSAFGRITFLISVILVFIFSILAITKGLTHLQYTVDTIDATNQDAIKIHDELVLISGNLKSVSHDATPVRDQLVRFLQQDICPLNPGSATESAVRNMGNSTLTAMIQLNDFIANQLSEVDQALSQVQYATGRIHKVVTSLTFTGGQAAAILIPFLLIPIFFIIALLMGWCGVYSEAYYFFITWIVLPIFIAMIMFSYFASAWSVVGTEGNADFCSGGVQNTPEATINNILQQYNVTADAFFFDVIRFYTNQCTTADPWGFLEGYFNELVRL